MCNSFVKEKKYLVDDRLRVKWLVISKIEGLLAQLGNHKISNSKLFLVLIFQ